MEASLADIAKCPKHKINLHNLTASHVSFKVTLQEIGSIAKIVFVAISSGEGWKKFKVRRTLANA
jgi:hypothetical protein